MTPPAQEDREQTEPERVVIRDNRKIDRQQEAATEPPPAAEPEPEIDENMKLLEERTADLQRLQAEYANYRKRSERDRLLAGDLATGRVLTELLPVLDDFDRARAHGDLEGGPLKAVADKLDAAFTKLGLAKFGEVGDAFDPSVHEAVLHDESDEVTVPTATTIMRPGYRHHDRLLRPAMVGVSDPAVAIDQPSDHATGRRGVGGGDAVNVNVEKDYYAALGVAKDAGAGEIKKTYRKLARDLHPDKNPGDSKAEARFKEVSEAYGVLSDPAKRTEYDEQRALFGAGGPRFGGANSGARSNTFDMSDLFGGAAGGGGANLNDLFGDLFGGGGRGTTRPRTGGPQRGRDVEAEIDLSFDDAVHGTTIPLRLTSPGGCRLCGGSGAKPGTSPRTCPTCGGSGSVMSNQGGFGFSEPCRDCRGTGRIVDDPCPECRGSGVTEQTRTITVRIPSGVRDGAKVRIPGKGTPGANGGPAGDLFVTAHVGKHRLFGRSGDDLTITVPITFAEAALGTTLRVPTLAAPVSLKVAAGTPSGRTMRVRGRGVSNGKKQGDLLVTVEVAVPQHLDTAARTALETYAQTQQGDPRPDITAALGGPHA